MLDPDGTVVSWNAGARQLKGYTQQEVLGQNFSHFFTPEDRAKNKPAEAIRIATETGRWEDEGWRIRKDGSRFWALAVLDAVRDPDGELIGFAKITRDMTERRLAQQALAESERRLRLLIASVVDYALFTLDLQGKCPELEPGRGAVEGLHAPMKSSESTFRCFTRRRHAQMPNRRLCSARPRRRAGSKVKAGGCARMAPAFGPTS